jgi:hypothetical protein
MIVKFVERKSQMYMVGFPVALRSVPPHFSRVTVKIVRSVSCIGSMRHVRRYFVTITQ